jgi:hypothetical protein
MMPKGKEDSSMKVNFIRKPTPEEIYPQTEAVIEKVVSLTKEGFEDLIHNPLLDRDYVKDNKDKMYKDDEGYMHCIFIICEGYDYGILVESEGYDYPRYTSYMPVDLFKIN